MKTHPPMEQPPEIGDDPQSLELGNYILWKFLQMPPGGLYAKWDEKAGNAVWFYSKERDYMFREPARDLVIYEERVRSRFRSLVFRFGALADEPLCGCFQFQKARSKETARYDVHGSFYPDCRIGLWIAITSRD